MILSSEQSALVQQIFTHFSPTQLHWLSGYISGKLDATNIATSASAINSTHQAVEAPATLSAQLTILYGSQSGNSKKVAQQAFQLAQDSGFNARLLSMSDYKVAN
jgi:sulfite reductase (NADPH) flavoprotein alpha-component